MVDDTGVFVFAHVKSQFVRFLLCFALHCCAYRACCSELRFSLGSIEEGVWQRSRFLFLCFCVLEPEDNAIDD
jgi:hypothetical protein